MKVASRTFDRELETVIADEGEREVRWRPYISRFTFEMQCKLRPEHVEGGYQHSVEPARSSRWQVTEIALE